MGIHRRNEIRIYCIHPEVSNLQEMIEYMCIWNEPLTSRMIWDEDKPEYVIVSENIYRLKSQFLKFKKFSNRKDIVFIASVGECLSADMNLFDYAVSYEKGFDFLDRIGRIPPTYIFRKKKYTFDFGKNDLNFEKAKKLLKDKKYFCNFIYSNPNAHPARDQIFFALSRYKKVDSLGAHLNNMHTNSTRGEKNWCGISVDLKSRYKFSIAAENAVQNGYNSEKIMSSFAAHTVPIYFGDPVIADDYNPKAFINANVFDNLEDLVNEVVKIDKDDELWAEMVSQPWQTEEQVEKIQREMEEYQNFIAHIFEQELKEAKRVIAGTFHDRYLSWFFRRFSRIDNLEYRMNTMLYKRKMKKRLDRMNKK